MKKILVIDNYDSFTFNLVHYIHKLHGEYPDVYRNDKLPLGEVVKYDKILLSPGPGIPVEAGICLGLIKEYAASKSILGVCLGHQAIGEAFGASLHNLTTVFHGLATPVSVLDPDEPLFRGVPANIKAGRYHSWVVDRNTIPECLTITCEDQFGTVMGISHKSYDVRGLQFHPESVLTEHGMEMISNWLKI